MNPCVRSHTLEQPCQRPAAQSDAPGRRRKALTREMDEYRAAAPGNARARIVVDLDDEVVEVILAPEPVARLVGPAAEGAVVAPVGGVLVPGIVRADRPDRKPRARPRRAVRPPPQPPQLKAATRRAPVAFALVGPDTAAPERHRNRQPPRREQAFSPLPGSGTHPEQTERPASLDAALAGEHERIIHFQAFRGASWACLP